MFNFFPSEVSRLKEKTLHTKKRLCYKAEEFNGLSHTSARKQKDKDHQD